MDHDLGLALNEACNSDGGLGVTKVNECDSALFLSIEVPLTEETVLECDRSRLVDKSETSEACNISSVEESLSLNVGEV